jgi:hypothetical protein
MIDYSLKRLASAVQLPPWPPSNQRLTSTVNVRLVPSCPKNSACAVLVSASPHDPSADVLKANRPKMNRKGKSKTF